MGLWTGLKTLIFDGNIVDAVVDGFRHRVRLRGNVYM